MRRKIMTFLGAVILGFASLGLTPVYAATATATADCHETLLGFRAWHYNLDKNADCSVKSIDNSDKNNNGETGEADLKRYVWQIILNVLFDIFLAVGYIAVGFIIYGGYMYIMAGGDAGKMALARKSITSAIVGILITVLATVIINTITTALTPS